MAKYRFLAADLLTNDIREEIPFTSATYGEILNRPGSFAASLPVSVKRTRTVPIPFVREMRDLAPSAFYRLGDRSGTQAKDFFGTQHGTYEGSPVLYQQGALSGDENRSVRLGTSSTSDGLVSVPTAAANFAGTSFTIAAWVMVDTLSAASEVFFGATATPATPGGVARVGITTAGAVEFYTDYASKCASAGGVISAGAWYFIAAVHDAATATQKIYVNGAQAATKSSATNVLSGGLTSALVGGVVFGSNLPSFRGSVDEASIWSGRALTASEVLVLHNAGTGTLRTTSVTTQVATRANLDPARTAIYVERDGLIRWGGILWTARVQDRVIQFGGEGFWSYLRRRLIRATKTYSQQDQLFIARDLVNYAQAQPGGNIGIIVGSETSGRLRDRTYYHYERKPIGEAIEQLAAVIDGFDFAIECAWNGSEIDKTLRLYYPERGRRTDLVFEEGEQGISEIQWNIDGTGQATLVDGIGAGEGDAMLITTAADTSLLSSYPLLEDTITYKDVSVLDTLAGHAQSVLSDRRVPIETFPQVVAHGPQIGLGTWIVGDQVKLVADNGYLDLDEYVRILSYNVKVSEQEREVVTVGISGE